MPKMRAELEISRVEKAKSFSACVWEKRLHNCYIPQLAVSLELQKGRSSDLEISHQHTRWGAHGDARVLRAGRGLRGASRPSSQACA